MSTETIRLDHPKLHRALQARLRMMLLDPAFTLSPKKQAKFRRMKLQFNEGDGCYTDFNRVVFGMNFPFFKGDINEQFNMGVTIAGHENAHLLFTHKPTWDKSVYSWMRKYGPLAPFAKDILNILEDRRIERLMGLVFQNLQRNFFLLGYRSVGTIEAEINERLKKEAPDTLMKLVHIRNLLLFISYTRILPNIDHPEIKEYLKQCYPYVLYARVADHTNGAVKATEKILEILKPLMDEHKASDDEKYVGTYKSKETGTTDPTSSEGLEGHSDKSEAMELPEEVEKMIREMLKKVKEEMEKDEIDKEEDGDGFMTAPKPEEESEEESEEGAGASGKSGSDEKDAKSSKDPSEKASSDASGKSGIRDYVDDIANNLDVLEEYKEEMKTEAKAMEDEVKAPVTAALLDDLLHSSKKERKQNFKMRKEAKTMEELDVKIETELHRTCEAFFKERKDMQMFSRFEYEELLKSLNQIIKKTVSQIREISQMAIEDTLRNQRSGRIDRRMLTNHQAFGDTKVFRSKEIETKQLQLEVMLLVDVSGSNSSQMLNEKNDTYVPRYVMNQTVAILLHEILKKLRFHHTIWTFDEESVKKQRFSSVVDRSNCFDKEAGLYIKEVNARANNRDGYSIRYAGEYLNRLSENPHRLMIVLSDGQPAAAGYGGHVAIEDVRLAVKEVEKKGSKVIGIFTGHESENTYFQSMYGDNAIFCNNESIFDLPKMLKKILLDEFQEIVGQTI